MKVSDSDNDSIFDDFTQNLRKTSRLKKYISKSNDSKELSKMFDKLTTSLKEVGAVGDPLHSLKCEQACILFEKKNFSQTAMDEARYDKQLGEIHAAIRSVELIKNPQEYQAYLKGKPEADLTKIPKGEPHNTFITRQNKNFGDTKKILDPAFKDFINARQSHLSLVAEMIKKEQASSLNVPFSSSAV